MRPLCFMLICGFIGGVCGLAYFAEDNRNYIVELQGQILILQDKNLSISTWIDAMIKDQNRIDLNVNLILNPNYTERTLSERQVKALMAREKKLRNPLKEIR